MTTPPLIPQGAFESAIRTCLKEAIAKVVAEESEAACQRVRTRIMPAIEEVAVRLRRLSGGGHIDELEVTVVDARRPNA